MAKKDPAAALRALAELAPGVERNAMTRGIFESLARGDAAQAIAYASQTHPGTERDAALTTLLEGWTGSADNNAPERRANRIASVGLEAGLGLELMEGNSPRPDLAVIWAQELTLCRGKALLLGTAAAAEVKTDPALAASYGSELTGEDQRTFNQQLITSWAPIQPEAAWQWSGGLADPAARAEAQNLAVEAQSSTNPQGAVAKLALLPAGDQRNQTLKVVAENYGKTSTDAALTWAQTLSPTDASVANAAISSVAPTGVGIMLAAEEGYPTISGLIPNMGAARSEQIHPGDRIMGVSQGDNQFVDAKQLDLMELVKMVRGTAGSLVQLQIAPALPGGGYGAPTVVPVIRQPIKHGG